MRGQILFEGRSFDDAVAAFKRTVDLDRRQAPYWSMLGDALRAVGRTDEALGAFKQAIDLVPTYSPALVRLGTALWEKRRFDEALEAVEKAIAINDGQYPHALAERGRILRERGRPGDREAAIDSFRQSIALDRNQPGTLVELAGLEWDRGDVGAAYEFSDAALAIAPTTVDAYVIRGRARRARGDLAGAIDDFGLAAQFQPDVGWHLAELGDVLLQAAKYDRALEALDAALARQPDLWVARATRAQVLRLTDRSGEAVEVLQEVLPHLSEPWVHFELGEALRQTGRPAEALASFDIGLQSDPDNHWALASRGSAQHTLGRYVDALHSFDRALVLEPAMDFARAAKAAVLIDIGRYAEARALLAQVDVALHPAWVWELRGWACELDGDGLGSYAAFTEHLRYQPESLWSRRGVAEALVLEGRDDEARAAFEEMLGASTSAKSVERDSMGAIGWAYLRLGQLVAGMRERHLKMAVQFLSSGLTVNDEVVPLQCDMGLALICAGRVTHGKTAYDRATAAAARLHPLRRAALLGIALDDLATSERLIPELGREPVVNVLRRRMQSLIEAAGREATRLEAGEGDPTQPSTEELTATELF